MLGLATMAAFALRLHDLGVHSLWFDEALELGRASGSLRQALVGRAIDQDPPVFALLTYAWRHLGDGEAWLRMPGVFMGVAAVVGAAAWSRRAFGPRVGALAALFLAVSPVLVHYSQELNQYAAMVLLAVAVIVAYERLLRRAEPWDLVLLTVVSIVALATHYGMAFLLAAITLHLSALVRRGDGPISRRELAWFVASLGVATAILWRLGLGDGMAVPHLDRRLGGTHLEKELDYITDVGWREILVFFTVPFSGGPALHVARALSLAAAAGAIILWRSGAAGRRAVGLYFFGPLALTYLASLMGWYPLGFRYGLFAVPAFFVAVAAAVDAAWRRRPVAGAALLAAALVGLLAYSTHTDEWNDNIAVPREDLRRVISQVEDRVRPDDTVYVYYGAVPAYAYYGRGLGAVTIEGRYLGDAAPADEVERLRRAATHRSGRAWVVFSHVLGDDESSWLAAVERSAPPGRRAPRVSREATSRNASVHLVVWPGTDREARRDDPVEDARIGRNMDAARLSRYTCPNLGPDKEDNPMNKTELSAKLAHQTGLTKAQAMDVVNALFDTDSGKGIIAVELDAGRTVTIPGFGTFATARRKARQGRNPQTGETIEIAARTVPVFKAGKGLKERVRV